MNIQVLRLRLSHLKQKWRNFTNRSSRRDDQQHVMSDDEKIDEASDESFPASDPPGHMSKSTEDRELH